MKIQIAKLSPKAVIPRYQTDHAAAMDLHACLDAAVTLKPGDRTVIPTGLAIMLPEGYESQIRARSGLSLKHGIMMANGVGTIDADYRGEYGVVVANISDESYVIEHGARIAQLVIAPVERVEWEETDTVDETGRGKGGYGSTGY